MPEIYSLLGFDSDIKSITYDMTQLCKITIYCKENEKDSSTIKHVNSAKVIDSYNALLDRIIERNNLVLSGYKNLLEDFTPILLIDLKKKIKVLTDKFDDRFISDLYVLNDTIKSIISDQQLNINIESANIVIEHLKKRVE